MAILTSSEPYSLLAAPRARLSAAVCTNLIALFLATAAVLVIAASWNGAMEALYDAATVAQVSLLSLIQTRTA